MILALKKGSIFQATILRFFADPDHFADVFSLFQNEHDHFRDDGDDDRGEH
ncbi:MAG: hypothetical protein IPI60_04190 [Saprospiraceae bacterium]|nr:hypothetical protein [Saprospiraceae bacterium]